MKDNTEAFRDSNRFFLKMDFSIVAAVAAAITFFGTDTDGAIHLILGEHYFFLFLFFAIGFGLILEFTTTVRLSGVLKHKDLWRNVIYILYSIQAIVQLNVIALFADAILGFLELSV